MFAVAFQKEKEKFLSIFSAFFPDKISKGSIKNQ